MTSLYSKKWTAPSEQEKRKSKFSQDPLFWWERDSTRSSAATVAPRIGSTLSLILVFFTLTPDSAEAQVGKLYVSPSFLRNAFFSWSIQRTGGGATSAAPTPTPWGAPWLDSAAPEAAGGSILFFSVVATAVLENSVVTLAARADPTSDWTAAETNGTCVKKDEYSKGVGKNFFYKIEDLGSTTAIFLRGSCFLSS